MANQVTTQWFDIHVKHGNYLPLEQQTTLAEEQAIMREEKEEEMSLENKLEKAGDQLNELEDDLDFDSDFMRQYLQKRRTELHHKAKFQKYGQVIQISRAQYVRQVTNAPPEDLIVLHLYHPSLQFCHLINRQLPAIAEAYPHTKFIKIEAEKCIENFPMANCPCFILYKGGKPAATITNVDKSLKQDVKGLQEFLRGLGVKKIGEI